MRNVLLLGGGTAGHITPNRALAPLLKNCTVHYAGAESGMEHELATKAGLPFHPVHCIKFARSFSVKNAAIPFVLMRGISDGKRLLKALEPCVIFSKGGYASLPVLLAAGKKYPYVLHESDYSLGLASRLAHKKAKYVLTAFEDTASAYDNGLFVGSPIRSALYFGDRSVALKECRLTAPKPYLLVFGGSQGAAAISNALLAALDSLLAYFNVIHITGEFGTKATPRDGYFALEFCNNMQDYYALADYCLMRGGAGSITEAVALKIPSLVIPLPKGNSRGDQEQNAEYYARRGLIRRLNQDELTPGTLVSELLALTRNRTVMKQAMAEAPSPDGTRKIAAVLQRFIDNA